MRRALKSFMDGLKIRNSKNLLFSRLINPSFLGADSLSHDPEPSKVKALRMEDQDILLVDVACEHLPRICTHTLRVRVLIKDDKNKEKGNEAGEKELDLIFSRKDKFLSEGGTYKNFLDFEF